MGYIAGDVILTVINPQNETRQTHKPLRQEHRDCRFCQGAASPAVWCMTPAKDNVLHVHFLCRFLYKTVTREECGLGPCLRARAKMLKTKQLCLSLGNTRMPQLDPRSPKIRKKEEGLEMQPSCSGLAKAGAHWWRVTPSAVRLRQI